MPLGDKISAAAKGFSDASYPVRENIDWLSIMHIKPLPGTSVNQSRKAVGTTIVMGNARYGNLLKAAAEANHKAIGNIDEKGSRSCPSPRPWTLTTPGPGS